MARLLLFSVSHERRWNVKALDEYPGARGLSESNGGPSLRSPAPVRLDLLGGQTLHLVREVAEDRVTLVNAGGETFLTLRVTPTGPVLSFERALTIETKDALELIGRRVALRGREGVEIESGADATMNIAGDLTSTARIQNLRASVGNVNVKANDDVRLIGERIKLNT